jgi:putative restriction endonuclease
MSAQSSEATRWLEKLSTLNVDPAKKTRSIGPAPHKPLLLLIVCDLVEHGALTGGLLHRDGALAFRFGTYWRIVADRRRTKPNLRLPFFHMRSDGFWHPLQADGRPAENREHAVLAQFDVSFLVCLQDPEFRLLARRTLIASEDYFEPTERSRFHLMTSLPQTLHGSFLPIARKRNAMQSSRCASCQHTTSHARLRAIV